jgi:hypothetical protein
MMNDTTKCWVIANFEIALFWCVVIIGAVIATIITLTKGGPVEAITGSVITSVCLAIVLTGDKRLGIVKYIILIITGVVLTSLEFIDDD